MSRAFLTLLTSENYLPGALVLAKSIKKTNSKYPVTILASKEFLSSKVIDILCSVFDKVILVETIYSKDKENLKLLGRMELDVTFTKLHCFNPDVVPFDTVAFLDADTLVLKNIDDIFEYVDTPSVLFAASPDIGWPDSFNSGVFVTKPNKLLYDALQFKAATSGSFDGGDQGLLNGYFSSWSRESHENPITARLPFIFNVTPSTIYSYLPAFQNFRNDIKVVHFIGASKPWKWNRTFDGTVVSGDNTTSQTLNFISYWWNIFDEGNLFILLNGITLDRDWSQYQPFVKESNTKASTTEKPGVPVLNAQVYSDFANYSVDWNVNELRPFKQYSSRKISANSAVSGEKSSAKKSVPSNSLVFSTQRPPSPSKQDLNPPQISPVKKSESSKSNVPQNTTSIMSSIAIPTVVDDIKALYGPGSVYTIHQTKASSPEIIDYTIDWNQDEIQGKIAPIGPNLTTNQNQSSPTRPCIRTNSFTISPNGVINYHTGK